MKEIMKMPHYGNDLANHNWKNIIQNVWDKMDELISAVNQLSIDNPNLRKEGESVDKKSCNQILRYIPTKPKETDRIYPCSKCGKLRSKDEGGTVFTVCDECWEKCYPKPKDKSLEEIIEKFLDSDCVLFKEDIEDLSQTIRNHIKEVCEKKMKHADSFVKEGRERLMAVSYNQALTDLMESI